MHSRKKLNYGRDDGIEGIGGTRGDVSLVRSYIGDNRREE
jgi:hypothetical protein